jgi:hypothetical protein
MSVRVQVFGCRHDEAIHALRRPASEKRQDDLRFSDCSVSVIQILDDADAAFRILGAGLRTVLSVTTMFADKPHRLNGRMRAAISCFDDLASGYRTRGWATRAAGYRAAISCSGTFETCRPLR